MYTKKLFVVAAFYAIECLSIASIHANFIEIINLNFYSAANEYNVLLKSYRISCFLIFVLYCRIQ